MWPSTASIVISLTLAPSPCNVSKPTVPRRLKLAPLHPTSVLSGSVWTTILHCPPKSSSSRRFQDGITYILAQLKMEMVYLWSKWLNFPCSSLPSSRCYCLCCRFTHFGGHTGVSTVPASCGDWWRKESNAQVHLSSQSAVLHKLLYHPGASWYDDDMPSEHYYIWVTVHLELDYWVLI